MPAATLLAWNDAWCTGVPEIDGDHKALIEDFQRLLRAEQHGDLDRQCIVFEALMEHICRHFDREEHLMRVHGYAELHQHAEVHAGLLHQLNQFETLLRTQPGGGVGPTILDFVGRWLIDHIQEDDRHLGLFLLNRWAERKAS